jgi:hypothetical protein
MRSGAGKTTTGLRHSLLSRCYHAGRAVRPAPGHPTAIPAERLRLPALSGRTWAPSQKAWTAARRLLGIPGRPRANANRLLRVPSQSGTVHPIRLLAVAPGYPGHLTRVPARRRSLNRALEEASWPRGRYGRSLPPPYLFSGCRAERTRTLPPVSAWLVGAADAVGGT